MIFMQSIQLKNLQILIWCIKATNNALFQRDEKRRATHNEVERRRRDKINNWIAKLAKILPDSPQDVKGNGQYDGHSKGGILAKAFEYIIELQATETRLGSCLKENKKLANAVDQLRSKNFALESENAELRELIKKHGLEFKRASQLI